MFRSTPLQYETKTVPAGMYLDINELGEVLQELASVCGTLLSDSQSACMQLLSLLTHYEGTLSKKRVGHRFAIEPGKCNLIVIEPGKYN